MHLDHFIALQTVLAKNEALLSNLLLSYSNYVFQILKISEKFMYNRIVTIPLFDDISEAVPVALKLGISIDITCHQY